MTTRSRTPRPSRRTADTEPTAAELRKLKLSPEVAWYMRDRGLRLPDCPPRFKTPEPRGKRYVFDPARVDRVLKAFGMLRHTKGQWAGRPLTPDPWQVAYIIAPVFGWVTWDTDAHRYVRVVNHLYVEVPRKNGKSTLIGGFGIYLTCADGEKGAEVIAAATTERQARLVFDPVRQLAAKGDPALTKYVKPRANRIVHERSGSYMEPVASVAEALHGGNIHGGLVDELHVHKSADLVTTIETGTGSRTQPLIAIITTADDGRVDTIYARKRDYIEKLSARALKDTSTYGVVWCADESDDPFAEKTWKKANPGYGVSPTRRYLREAATRARNSPLERAAFLQLHLGLRVNQQGRYVELVEWDRNAGLVDEKLLRQRVAYGGLDLASTSDLCSLCWILPHDDGSYDALWRHWCPEDAFRSLNTRTAGAAQLWRNEGWLTVTAGNVADYDFIRAQVNRDREQFDVSGIGYDRWNASQLVTDLVADEAPMVQIGQGYATMSAPLKQIKHLLLEGTDESPRFRHGGNPLMRWQTTNLSVASDAAGNVKPDKRKSTDKIDGWSAAVDAMAMVMQAEPPQRSAYEDDDLMVV